MKLSIVVCTYKRLEPLKRLILSIRREFAEIDYEIVVVASDSYDSQKCIWASRQEDVLLLPLGDRRKGQKRQKSLYYYENLGLDASTGEWILVTNDDTEFEPGSAKSFLEMSQWHDVIVIPAELDDPTLGKRAPVVGEAIVNAEVRPIFLLDFAFIRRSIWDAMGPSDELLDWYGGGGDRGIKVSLMNNVKLGVLAQGGLTHHLEIENRTPPHALPDSDYLVEKWVRYSKLEKDISFNFFGAIPKKSLPLFWYKSIWPILERLRKLLFSRAQ